jgi:hypothetical protein
MGEARRGAVANKVPTVGEYWLREVIEPNRAPLTFVTYETLCRLYIVPGLGKKRLDRLTVRDLLCDRPMLSVTAVGPNRLGSSHYPSLRPVERDDRGADHEERRGLGEGPERTHPQGAGMVG